MNALPPISYMAIPAVGNYHFTVDRFCLLRGIEPDDFTGRCRLRRLSIERQIFVYLKWHAGLTHEEIGRLIHRDHATSIHHLRVAEAQLELSKTFRTELSRAASQLMLAIRIKP